MVTGVYASSRMWGSTYGRAKRYRACANLRSVAAEPIAVAYLAASSIADKRHSCCRAVSDPFARRAKWAGLAAVIHA